MASSIFGNHPQRNQSPMQMMQQIRSFAQAIQGKGDPEQMARQFAAQNGIDEQRFNATVNQARQILQSIGSIGMRF